MRTCINTTFRFASGLLLLLHLYAGAASKPNILLIIPDDIQGYSLKPILEGKAEQVRDASYYHFYAHGTGLPEMVGIRTERYKLIHYPGMDAAYQFELFDLKNDSDEMTNQSGNPEFQEVVQRMKAGLKGLIADYEDPVELPNL